MMLDRCCTRDPHPVTIRQGPMRRQGLHQPALFPRREADFDSSLASFVRSIIKNEDKSDHGAACELS